MKKPRKSVSASKSIEDIRIGYSSAIQLAIYDGQLSWQITGTFVQVAILMIAGAVFPSFIGSADKRILGIAGLLVSIAGAFLTAMFGSMVRRIRTYEEYWILRATELESHLNPLIETLKGSDVLSRTGAITTPSGSVHLPRGTGVKSKLMLATLFGIFILTFIGLAFVNIWRLVSAIIATC